MKGDDVPAGGYKASRASVANAFQTAALAQCRNDMNVLQLAVVEWADYAFPGRTPQLALLKLFEEVGELVRDPTSPGEYADILIMVFDMMAMHGISPYEAVMNKLQINLERKWAVTASGTLQHTEQVR